MRNDDMDEIDWLMFRSRDEAPGASPTDGARLAPAAAVTDAPTSGLVGRLMADQALLSALLRLAGCR